MIPNDIPFFFCFRCAFGRVMLVDGREGSGGGGGADCQITRRWGRGRRARNVRIELRINTFRCSHKSKRVWIGTDCRLDIHAVWFMWDTANVEILKLSQFEYTLTMYETHYNVPDVFLFYNVP